MIAESGQWTIARIWEALRTFWMLIVALSLLGGVVGYAISSTKTPEFQASASLYFALNQGTSGADLNQGSTYTQNQMLSFARLATSSRVLEPVIDELDLGITPRDLARSVSIVIPQDTVILEVTATSTDPARAAEIANAISSTLSQVVQEVAADGADGVETISASVIDDAVSPTVQSVPNKVRDAALAAVLGMLVGVLAAFIATIGDTRARNAASVARVTSLPVLGSITRARRGIDVSMIVARDPHSHVAEDVRRVQSALAFAALDGRSRRLLITSASPSEGKSTFASSLAVTLADSGERVLVIDADLRRPRMHELFGVDGSVGLTTTLMGEVSLPEAIVEWGERGPDVLVSGALPPNPAAVVTSHAFKALLETAGEHYDTLIIDSPPTLTVADANLLVPLADGVVLVVDASKTHRQQLANAVRSVESAGGTILGIVLNRTRPPRGRVSYYAEAPPEDLPKARRAARERSTTMAHR